MSEIKVNSIKGVGASAAAITVNNTDGTATANLTNRQNRNVIINGDLQIAQRSTSSTNVNYGSVDRWTCQQGGLDEACTQAQVDVAEGTSPYGLGFRKAWKITNGNQTSGAGASDYIELYQYIEGHNMATCGWDYKNPNSKMTLSFWVKSSVAQKFPGFLYTTLANGTSVGYMYDYSIDNGGSNLTADTWTKITHTFPGNSNLNITNGTNYGLGFGIYLFSGTNLTTSRSPSNAWQVWSTSNKTPDVTSTWYTTNDATFELTGVQLEVGPVATPFEHRSFGDELIRCQRYYYRHATGNGKGISENATQYNGSTVFLSIPLPTEMRAQPTLEIANGSGYFVKYANNGPVYFNTLGRDGITTPRVLCINGTASGTAGHACMIRTDDANSYVAAVAEL